MFSDLECGQPETESPRKSCLCYRKTKFSVTEPLFNENIVFVKTWYSHFVFVQAHVFKIRWKHFKTEFSVPNWTWDEMKVFCATPTVITLILTLTRISKTVAGLFPRKSKEYPHIKFLHTLFNVGKSPWKIFVLGNIPKSM